MLWKLWLNYKEGTLLEFTYLLRNWGLKICNQEHSEFYRKTFFSGFNLSVSENHSSVVLYEGLDLGSYAPLASIPTRSPGDFYTLEDVLANGQTLSKQHINLLVAVRKVRDVVVIWFPNYINTIIFI